MELRFETLSDQSLLASPFGRPGNFLLLVGNERNHYVKSVL